MSMTMAELLTQIRIQIPPDTVAMSYEELQLKILDEMNNESGCFSEFDCPKCKNKGLFHTIDDQFIIHTHRCSCMDRRKIFRNARESGLDGAFSKYKYSNFIVSEPWQARLLEGAKKYAIESTNEWFFIGGQSGCGKTHLCTAIVGKLLGREKTVRYMPWREDATAIKAVANDPVEYQNLISPLKKSDILYIDDFFKLGATDADKRLAFEIINARTNGDRQTIISSEQSIDEIIGNIDAATGGRIYERSAEYTYYISPDSKKNYRLRVNRHD